MPAPQTPGQLRDALTEIPENIVDEQVVEAQDLALEQPQEDDPNGRRPADVLR